LEAGLLLAVSNLPLLQCGDAALAITRGVRDVRFRSRRYLRRFVSFYQALQVGASNAGKIVEPAPGVPKVDGQAICYAT
jgi:hypothetical protein